MKKFTAFYLFILLLALFVLVLPGITTNAEASYSYKVDVEVNGKYVNFPDQKPFIDTGVNRTYVPLRFVSEALGADVNWDSANQTAVVKLDRVINMKINSKYPTVDGKAVTLDAPAMLLNNRTVVPLRFVSEVLGAQVKWEPPVGKANGKVIITTKDGVFLPPDTKVINGYIVPMETDLKVDENLSGGCEISILMTVSMPMEKQLQDAYNILASKLGHETAKTIINYVSPKKDRWDNVPDKAFYLNDREITAAGPKGSYHVDIVVWK